MAQSLPLGDRLRRFKAFDDGQSPAIAAGTAAGDRVEGAGGWVMVSQERQENRSRTVWMTFHCRGRPPASR